MIKKKKKDGKKGDAATDLLSHPTTAEHLFSSMKCHKTQATLSMRL
jgi:hypothetical protein